MKEDPRIMESQENPKRTVKVTKTKMQGSWEEIEKHYVKVASLFSTQTNFPWEKETLWMNEKLLDCDYIEVTQPKGGQRTISLCIVESGGCKMTNLKPNGYEYRNSQLPKGLRSHEGSPSTPFRFSSRYNNNRVGKKNSPHELIKPNGSTTRA